MQGTTRTVLILAALAEVAPPASDVSPGAVYLRRVHEGVTSDLAEIGPRLHVECLRLAAEDALPDSRSDAYLACLDLGLWSEELPTVSTLAAAGQRLGAALVAQEAAQAFLCSPAAGT